MKSLLCLVFALSLLSVKSWAEDPAVEAPAAQEKPAEKAAPIEEAKKEEPAQTASAKPAPPPAEKKAPAGCSAALQSIADAYRQAHEKMQQWVDDSSKQVEELDKKRGDLKTTIAEKEAQITKLKLEPSKSSKNEIRQLNQETKQLWKDLKGVEGENSALCKSLSRAAAQQVRELNAMILQELEQARAGMR